MRSVLKRIGATAAMTAVTVSATFALTTGTAHAESVDAQRDDSFAVSTTENGGYAAFVDYGPGAPGHGDNDDYVEIGDEGWDGYGVRAWAWVNGDYKGRKYFGGGMGESTTWDPFGNVKPGQKVKLRVCLVDGPDAEGVYCASKTRTVTDG
ncbi:hypothetical protein FB566_5036 [Stackebrandtia endophytica]|uniref:Secreted protein n=1 Tax=Stackebrandtia endophytica TaxID=1496996 RepID=A0A543B3U0_9ACTN|nr:hypothetical protein [Stackebrandtia endophytica]TQL79430.1 hypothetical protein FB566_5036 [Stackebrandtia endophytica]